MGYGQYSRRTNYATYNYGWIEYRPFKTLSEIEKVIEQLKLSILEKGFATVAEYYELTNGEVIKGDSETGWTELTTVKISAGRYGYMLEMPAPYSIKPSNPIDSAINTLRDAIENDDMSFVEDACNILQDLNK